MIWLNWAMEVSRLDTIKHRYRDAFLNPLCLSEDTTDSIRKFIQWYKSNEGILEVGHWCSFSKKRDDIYVTCYGKWVELQRHSRAYGASFEFLCCCLWSISSKAHSFRARVSSVEFFTVSLQTWATFTVRTRRRRIHIYIYFFLNLSLEYYCKNDFFWESSWAKKRWMFPLCFNFIWSFLTENRRFAFSIKHSIESTLWGA